MHEYLHFCIDIHVMFYVWTYMCVCINAAVIHPFAEIVSYFTLFLVPVMTVTLTGTSSIVVVFGYVTYIDFMNNLGHCNFELIPRKLFTIFPVLKYIMYTPTYVSLPSLMICVKIWILLPPANSQHAMYRI